MKTSLFKGISVAMIVGFSVLLIYYFFNLSIVNIAVELSADGAEQSWFGTVLLIIATAAGILSGIIGLASYSVSARYISIVLTVVLRICALFILHSSIFALVLSFGLPVFYLVGLYQEIRACPVN